MANKIGRNTIMLSIRTLFIMIVSLYTSRVILDKLGVDDYGLYGTIGSVVSSLSFLNASLGLSASRFITYDIGVEDNIQTNKTFNNILVCYIVLTVIVVVILEAIGPWFISEKLVYDSTRAEAVQYLFQFSLVTVVFSLLSTPFTSLIIAHEDMDVYAYIGIYEALLKIAVAYAITISPGDKLIFYALLMMFAQLSVTLINIVYSRYKYKETKITFHTDKNILLSILGFSGWSLIGPLSGMMSNQGATIITNMFFGPAVVAARTISLQVNNALNSFVTQFRTAVSPQIVKRHASGDQDGMIRLVIKSTILSFIIGYIVCLPFIVNTDYILHLWLKEVPDYSIPFVQLILIQSLISIFDQSFYSIFYAHGRIKENSMISPIISLVMFVIVYVLFKLGYNPLWFSYCYLLCTIITSVLIKPYLLYKFFGYSISILISIFKPCLLMILFTIPVFFLHFLMLEDITFFRFLLESLLIVIWIAISSFFIAFDKNMKLEVIKVIKRRLN